MTGYGQKRTVNDRISSVLRKRYMRMAGNSTEVGKNRLGDVPAYVQRGYKRL